MAQLLTLLTNWLCGTRITWSGCCENVQFHVTEHNDSLRSDYVVPESIADRPFYERLDWLLEDMKSDDLMHGVPRYQPRYTAREHELASYLASLDRNPRSGHIVHQDVLNRGRCDICGAPNNAHPGGES